MTSSLKQSWLLWPITLILLTTAPKTLGSPSAIFFPHLNQIKNNLGSDLVIRLPSYIPYTTPNLEVTITSSLATPGITISLFNCSSKSQSCLIGSFATNSYQSQRDQEALQRHRTQGKIVPLTDNIQGYLLDSPINNPDHKFFSIMWEQDGLIYTTRFFSQEPENTIELASSIAEGQLISHLSEFSQSPEVAIVAPDPSNNLPDNQPVPPTETEIISPPKTPPQTAILPADLNLNIIGNSAISDQSLAADAKLQELLDSLKGKTITDRELNIITELANTITQIYLEQGYFNTIAIPVEENLSDIADSGIVQIQVFEGSITEIKVERIEGSSNRLRDDYITSRITLGLGQPLRTEDIEEQLRILRIDPLLEEVEATLQSSGERGKSILVVTIKEASSFQAKATIDNESPSSVGSERFGLEAEYRNLTGFGDSIYGSYFRSFTGGSNDLNFFYTLPLNPMDGSLNLRISPSWTRVTEEPFDRFEITGNRQIYEISYRQPVIRKVRENLALSLGFTYNQGQTFTFDKPTPFGIGPDEDGVSKTSVIWFRQEYLNRDPKGSWFFSSQFNIGTGLFNATTNDAPIPDGYFFSWSGQAQRVQKLGEHHLLIFQTDVQLTPNSLLPAQQFVIGGGQSVRGYRQNARSGDSGIRFSLEDRITLLRNKQQQSQLQIAPFFDLGYVWNNPDNPNELLKQNLLMSLGLGLIWQPLDGLSIRVSYGYPLIDLEDRGNNVQDYGLYFRINYSYSP
jgi:hemolysin activation/secretion protein